MEDRHVRFTIFLCLMLIDTITKCKVNSRYCIIYLGNGFYTNLMYVFKKLISTFFYLPGTLTTDGWQLLKVYGAVNTKLGECKFLYSHNISFKISYLRKYHNSVKFWFVGSVWGDEMPWSNTLKYIIDIYALLYSLPPTSLRIVAFLNYPFKVLGMKLLHKYTILLQPSFPFLKDSRFLKYSSMANRVTELLLWKLTKYQSFIIHPNLQISSIQHYPILSK